MSEKDPSWTWQLVFDPAEMEKRRVESRSFFLPKAGLCFVDDHFGPRPGCLHTLLGSAGRGKSTLVQSLILEWGKKANVLLYLSEEAIESVELKLFEKEEHASYLSTRLHLTSEEEMLKSVRASNPKSFLEILSAKIESSESKILIIDNLTTSQFYESNFSNVLPILSGLKDLASRHKIPVFVVCHTKRGVNESTKGLLSSDDARGSASLGNISDYFYIFYRIHHTTEFGGKQIGTFIYVEKSRHHENQSQIYRLDYNVNQKRYVKDLLVDFNVFRNVVRSRDRL